MNKSTLAIVIAAGAGAFALAPMAAPVTESVRDGIRSFLSGNVAGEMWKSQRDRQTNAVMDDFRAYQNTERCREHNVVFERFQRDTGRSLEPVDCGGPKPAAAARGLPGATD